MCIKLTKNNETYEYDLGKTFQEQIEGCTEAFIKYEPNDESIGQFLQGMYACAKNGKNPHLKIKIECDNFLAAYKVKRDLNGALNDIDLNEIAKLLVLSQHNAEQKLEEISLICTNRYFDGK
jgi:hypothetical protein